MHSSKGRLGSVKGTLLILDLVILQVALKPQQMCQPLPVHVDVTSCNVLSISHIDCKCNTSCIMLMGSRIYNIFNETKNKSKLAFLGKNYGQNYVVKHAQERAILGWLTS